MNPPTDLNIVIPAIIAALPGLNLAERVALALIAKRPGCSNASLARALDMSLRGAESLLRRLRAKGLIKPVGKGRARRHILMLPVEHHISGGKNEDMESHTDCVVEPLALPVTKTELPTAEFIMDELSFYENCWEAGNYEAARLHLEAARKRLDIDTEVPVQPIRRFLAGLKWREDRCFALESCLKMIEQLPPAEGENVITTLCRASAEKLALFRERVESGASMEGSKGVLGLVSG